MFLFRNMLKKKSPVFISEGLHLLYRTNHTSELWLHLKIQVDYSIIGILFAWGLKMFLILHRVHPKTNKQELSLYCNISKLIQKIQQNLGQVQTKFVLGQNFVVFFEAHFLVPLPVISSQWVSQQSWYCIPGFSIICLGRPWMAKESLKTDAQEPNKHYFYILRLEQGPNLKGIGKLDLACRRQ